MEIEKLLERQNIPVDVKKRLKEYFIKYKRMEEAHQELELQMVKTLDSMADPIHVIDTDLRFIFFNMAFKQWNKELGLEEDVIGKTVHEVFPFLPDIVIDEYHQVFKYGKTLTTEGSIQIGEKEFFTETRKIPIFERGKVTRIITAIRNITEHQQADKTLREAKEKYQMLVEKMEEGVALEDTEGIITFVNPRTAKMLGYTEEELVGKHWSLIVPKEFHEKHRFEESKRSKGIRSTYESSLLAKDGTRIPVIISATSIISTTGEFQGILVVTTDITQRKQIEEALRQVKLEEERYHAMLSHFVNNDLQVIINNLEMLMLKFESSQVMDDSLANRIMDVASRSSKTIDNVNKIFEVLQFPFDHAHREKNNLLASIDEAVSELQSVLSFSCNIIINRESLDKMILGDKHLKDIFYELILFSQSSKEDYMDEKSPVFIEGCQNPSYFCVSIRDSLSHPITEEISIRLSKKITEEWEYQGHYIGIALASVIMQHYGGSLKILPLDRKGNEFQLYFPLDLLQYSKDS